ncbi:MAG: hypothetical protein KDK97_06545 [Verrucomicrobiales bacterium]|nr:hypothetical protein [Verrucomicrobiales bacterium]MCP5558725.1 hypothetical protein [Verrucomicrobiaceae bacterium]
MRGYPPLHLLVLLLAFAGIAVPLWRLTAGSGRVVMDHQTPADHDGHVDEDGTTVVQGGETHPDVEHRHEEVPALIRLRYAHKPLSVSLQQEGRELLTGIDLSETPAEVTADIEVSHEGDEMVLSATWPAGTPETAVTIEIEPDGFERVSQTIWTAGSLDEEVVLFKW